MKAVIAFFKAGSPWSIIIALLVLVLAAVPVAAVLGLLSIGLDFVYMRGRLIRAMGENTWEQQKNFLLIAIPMFILMGEIILRAGIARRMYEAVAGWLSWLLPVPTAFLAGVMASLPVFAASVPGVDILVTDDVVLTQIGAALHLDQMQIDLAGVFQPVHGPQRNVDRLVLGQQLHVLVYCDAG